MNGSGAKVVDRVKVTSHLKLKKQLLIGDPKHTTAFFE